ncbi:MAG: hypothetical protein JRN20_21915 [Nitrososphaerota archaeon]|nr:hypothetical protein [Nitrososphaerota archaeon]
MLNEEKKNWIRVLLLLFMLLLLFAGVPPSSSAVRYVSSYASSSAYVQNPSVLLESGNSPSGVLPTIAPERNSASASLSAGLTFYISSVPPTTGTAPPTVDTSFTPPAARASFTITRGSSVYLWSPQYPASVVVYSGSWLLDIYAYGKKTGSMRFSVYATDSTGTVVSTIASNVATSTIGTTLSNVNTTFGASEATVPSSGYIELVLTAPTGPGNPQSFTVYFGGSDPSNIETTKIFGEVLAVNNPTSSSWLINLGVASSSETARLNNFTVWLASPVSKQISLGNLVTQQLVGPQITLPADATIYISFTATADTFGTSYLTLSLKVENLYRVYSQYTVNVGVD